MAKVRSVQAVPEIVHNEGLGGVKVTIQLHSEREREQVTISLPYPCAWQGRLIEREQRYLTDERGRVVVMLPPSGELVPLNPRGQVPVSYKLSCAPVGVMAFEVPDTAEWTLGT